MGRFSHPIEHIILKIVGFQVSPMSLPCLSQLSTKHLPTLSQVSSRSLQFLTNSSLRSVLCLPQVFLTNFTDLSQVSLIDLFQFYLRLLLSTPLFSLNPSCYTLSLPRPWGFLNPQSIPGLPNNSMSNLSQIRLTQS